MIVLETERLLFRDHSIEDLEPFCAMQADPEVRRYVGGKPRSRQASEEKFRSAFLIPNVERKGMWATVFKPEGCYVGYCGVYANMDSSGLVPDEGVLGFYIARTYWGRGIATEAGRAFIEFGFGELHLSRIVSTVQVGNDASIHIMKKLGFTLMRREEGELRKYDHFEIRNPAGQVRL